MIPFRTRGRPRPPRPATEDVIDICSFWGGSHGYSRAGTSGDGEEEGPRTRRSSRCASSSTTGTRSGPSSGSGRRASASRRPSGINPQEVPGRARRAARGPAGAERQGPLVTAGPATEGPLAWKSHGSTTDPQGVPVNERSGHLPARRLDDPGEGGPGNLHARRGLFLVEALEVGEPQGLELVERQLDLFELRHRHTGRLEVGVSGRTGDAPGAGTTRHVSLRPARRRVHPCRRTDGAGIRDSRCAIVPRHACARRTRRARPRERLASPTIDPIEHMHETLLWRRPWPDAAAHGGA